MRTPVENKRFSFDLVEAAVMLFSAVDEYTLLAFKGLPEDHPSKARENGLRAWREGAGASSARYYCIALADASQRVWVALGEEERDFLTWDFEFIPDFVLHCVDWENHEPIGIAAALPTRDLLKRYRDGKARHSLYIAEHDARLKAAAREA